MSKEEIDSEILINSVQDKPGIWDKATEDYKNRNKTTEAWRSICAQLKENFENLSDGERKEFEQGLYHRSTDSSMAYEHTDEAESQQQTEELQSAADQGTATPDATKQTSQTPSAKIPTVKTTSV
ncbi:hypothetical protein JTB14_020784 [Gonioctena quinquepunctata]|nr:hypothetical protein JTB14_020784 [Gonioctena quinquepunctata]